eukprot:jgi/Tetstr1/464489/TSEL_009247.t1
MAAVVRQRGERHAWRRRLAEDAAAAAAAEVPREEGRLARLQGAVGAAVGSLAAADGPSLRRLVDRQAAPYLRLALSREGAAAEPLCRAALHALLFAALRPLRDALPTEAVPDELAAASRWRLPAEAYARLVRALHLQAEAAHCLRWLGAAEGTGWAAALAAVLGDSAAPELLRLPGLLPALLDPEGLAGAPRPAPALLGALADAVPSVAELAEGGSGGAADGAALAGALSRLVCHGLAAGWFADNPEEVPGASWAVAALSDLLASGVEAGDVSRELPAALGASIDATIAAQAASLPPHFTARCHLRTQLLLRGVARPASPAPAPALPSPPPIPPPPALRPSEPLYRQLMGSIGQKFKAGAEATELGGEAEARALGLAAASCLPGQPACLVVPPAVWAAAWPAGTGGASPLRVSLGLAGMLQALGAGEAQHAWLVRLLRDTLTLVAAAGEQRAAVGLLVTDGWFAPLRRQMAAAGRLKAEAVRGLVSISNRMVGVDDAAAARGVAPGGVATAANGVAGSCAAMDEALIQELLPLACLHPHATLQRLLSDGLRHSGQLPAVLLVLRRLPALLCSDPAALTTPQPPAPETGNVSACCSELRRQLVAEPGAARGVINATADMLSSLVRDVPGDARAPLLSRDTLLCQLAVPLMEEAEAAMPPTSPATASDGNASATRAILAIAINAARLSLGLVGAPECEALSREDWRGSPLLTADARGHVLRLVRCLLRLSGLPRRADDHWIPERAAAGELLRSIAASLAAGCHPMTGRPARARRALALSQELLECAADANWSSRVLLVELMPLGPSATADAAWHPEHGVPPLMPPSLMAACPIRERLRGKQAESLPPHTPTAREQGTVRDWFVLGASLPPRPATLVSPISSKATDAPSKCAATALSAMLARRVTALPDAGLRLALLAEACTFLPGLTQEEAARLTEHAIPALLDTCITAAVAADSASPATECRSRDPDIGTSITQEAPRACRPAAVIAEDTVRCGEKSAVGVSESFHREDEASHAPVVSGVARAITLDLLLRAAIVTGRAGQGTASDALIRQYCAAAESASTTTKAEAAGAGAPACAAAGFCVGGVPQALRCLRDGSTAAAALARIPGADASPLSVLLMQLLERLAPALSGATNEIRVCCDAARAALSKELCCGSGIRRISDSGDEGRTRTCIGTAELLQWVREQVATAPPSMRQLLEVAVARLGRASHTEGRPVGAAGSD